MAEPAIKLTGLKELDAKLARMDRKLGFKALRSALNEAAKPMFLAAKKNAQATGIKGFDAGSTAAAMGRFSKKRGPKSLELFIGPKNKAKKAVNLWNQKHGTDITRLNHFHLVEFGSKKGPAQPFMRPAFESTKVTVARSFGKILAIQIEKQAGRASN
jgi:HK97 gp10 family phage protein